MNTKILDGKKVSLMIAEKLKKQIKKYKEHPTLAILQVGEVKESSAYIAHKKRFAEKIGAEVLHIILPIKIKQEEILEIIQELNSRKDVHGIIVQLPLPKHLDRYNIMESITPEKDVDGLNSKNAGLLYERAFGGNDPRNVPEGLLPATAKGVLSLLKFYKIPILGKKAVVVGRSLLVGKPVAMLLLRENATVNITHSKTKNLKKEILEADIVVVAVGSPELIKSNMLRRGQVVVDVGTNSLGNKKILEEVKKIKLVGDVDFDKAFGLVSYISPVPGGVGPMTVASLFENLVSAYRTQKGV